MARKHEVKSSFQRVDSTYDIGLLDAQVTERLKAGANNKAPKPLTRTYRQIIWDNTFTLFNMLNLFLAMIVISIGEYKSALFFGVAICNTFISIFQEIRAKKTIDKMSIVTQTKVQVVRNGERVTINQAQVVIDDVVYLNTGAQACVDGVIIHSEGLEADESLLTGEADFIDKKMGATILSGSFVVAGSGFVRTTSVGDDNYASKISQNSKREKKPTSELIRTLNQIIKVLTFVIIPIGILLFSSKYFWLDYEFEEAVLGTTAGMIGMIPEGLMLLTGIAFAVGAVNLILHKTLVQNMPSIETLARVDVLCLDKTGTITDGSLNVVNVINLGGMDKELIELAISNIIYTLDDSNATSTALKKTFTHKPSWQAIETRPFSSLRKWSGVRFLDKGAFVMGAPEFVIKDLNEEVEKEINNSASCGQRLLLLAHSNKGFNDKNLPDELSPCALIVIADNIRAEAPETMSFFHNQGVELKIISGDDPATVSAIATRAGMNNAQKYINMHDISDSVSYKQIVDEYSVFGRVSPYQKKELIQAIKGNGHTVAMVGDGVNDVMALREADCGVAMLDGSDAARHVSDVVLLDSNFHNMMFVVMEGRRIVNNIHRVAALYLVKTIYSAILSVAFIFLPLNYPFSPIQLTLIGTLMVGIPSFFLALIPSYELIEGRFAKKIVNNSLPAALSIVMNIFFIQALGVYLNLSFLETSTLCVIITGFIGYLLLFRVSKPLDYKKVFMLVTLGMAFLLILTFFTGFFSTDNIYSSLAYIYLPLVLLSKPMFEGLTKAVNYLYIKFSR